MGQARLPQAVVTAGQCVETQAVVLTIAPPGTLGATSSAEPAVGTPTPVVGPAAVSTDVTGAFSEADVAGVGGWVSTVLMYKVRSIHKRILLTVPGFAGLPGLSPVVGGEAIVDVSVSFVRLLRVWRPAGLGVGGFFF